MNKTAKETLLKELFTTDANRIGVSYLRVSIGASDLSEQVFPIMICLPGNQTDIHMKKFSLEPEIADLIPLLKETIAINSAVKIMGSPRSPPVWMKTTNSSKGGSLKPAYYDAYARYFVKYIQRYAGRRNPHKCHNYSE